MPERLFMDGTGITPGTEGCKCGPSCEMNCWERIGIAPACKACGCAPFEEDKAQTPGAMEIEVERQVPGGTIRFEQAPAGWLSKNGQPRVQDWRAYFWVPDDGRRVRLPSVTTWLSSILPKDLTRWGEMHGIIGAVEAIRRGELDPSEHTDEDAVERVRALKLGADAARDRAAGRGIDVHAFLEDYGRTGRMPSMDVPMELAGYVKGLQDFIADFDPEPVAVELLVADPDEGYAGRLDLKAHIRSEHFPSRDLRVCDLKTSPKRSIWPAAHAQTRAYARADERCGGEPSATPLIVVVDAEGRYDVRDCLCSDEQLDAALRWYRSVSPINSACESRHRQLRKAAA